MQARALVALACLVVACGSDAPPILPNVVLVSLDTVRADHTSLLGYPRPTTPRLSALAREGLSYPEAYAMTSTTAPSHATLFTGRYAPAHGVVRNGIPLAEGETTLAEHLAARGYQTAGFVSSFVLAKRFGLAQGFGVWDDRFDPATSSMKLDFWEGHVIKQGFDRSGEATNAAALAWLADRDRNAPFFLFVHYFDAHEPYTPSDAERAGLAGPAPVGPLAEAIDRYDAEIRTVDRALGRLLDAIDSEGLRDHTWVIVTSDHGQGLADHDDPFHSVNLYEEAVRSVMVVRGPGVTRPGRVERGPVEQSDLLPTVLDLLAAGSQRALLLPGRSLRGSLEQARPLDPARPVFLYRQWYPRRMFVRDTTVDGEQFGVRVGTWKYIEGRAEERRELYDLSRDPGERENRFAEEPARAAALADRLRGFRLAHPRPGSAPAVSPEDRERLRALGYVE